MLQKLCSIISALILTGALFAAEPLPAASPLPEGKIVIVVKDYEVLKSAAAASPAAPPATAEPEKKPGRAGLQLWWSQLHEKAVKFNNWLSNQTGELLLFLAGAIATPLLAALLTLAAKRFFRSSAAHSPYLNFPERLYRVFHRPFFCFLTSFGIFLSAQPLLASMPGVYSIVWFRLLLAALSISVIWGIFRFIGLFDDILKKRAQMDPDRHMDTLLIDLLRKTVKVVVVIIAVFFIIQNILGMNITSLLAGAGVVGLAIAFAAQETIANVFGSIMIILDKPFAVGERIKLGTVDGTVESVGLRSTQVRSLDGHLYSIPNRQVADGTIENVTKRTTIKYPFSIGLTYDTPPEKMEEACRILHEILDNHPGFDMQNLPPRIFFTDYRDWSLSVSVTVWFNTQDFILSQEWKHAINLEILRRFNAAGLNFAFPTNTTFLAGDANSPVAIRNV